MTGIRSRRVVALLLLTMTMGACISTKPPSRTGLITAAPHVVESSRQIVMRLDEFTAWFLGAVEFRADQIRDRSGDPDIDLAGLVWKMNVTSAMLRATSHNDPLLSLLDAWVLSYQMQDFFTTGLGADDFGELTPIAVQLSDTVLQEIEGIANRIATAQGVTTGRQMVVAFASANPVVNELFLRRSVASEIIATMPQSTRDAFAAVGAVTETLESLTARLAIYMDYMPRQARWQAELLLEQPRYSALIDEASDSMLALRSTIESIGDVVAESPALDEGFTDAVDGVVDALEQAVDELETLVDRQRRLIESVIADKQDQITGFVQSERIAVMNEANQTVLRALDRVDALSQELIAEAGTMSEARVNQIYWRVLQLIGVAFFAALGILIASRLLPRPKTQV